MLRKDRVRVELWKLGLENFKSHPSGTGPSTFEHIYRKNRGEVMMHSITSSAVLHAHSHNAFVETLSSTGLLGLIALVAIYSRASFPKTPEERRTWLGIICGGIPLMLNPGPLEGYAVLALLLGTLAHGWSTGGVARRIGRLFACTGVLASLVLLVSQVTLWGRMAYPCEPLYLASMAERFPLAIKKNKAEEWPRIYQFLEDESNRLVACRKESAQAWISRAQVKSLGWQMGYRPRLQAVLALARAEELDPHSEAIPLIREQLNRR